MTGRGENRARMGKQIQIDVPRDNSERAVMSPTSDGSGPDNALLSARSYAFKEYVDDDMGRGTGSVSTNYRN
jgi:hypothetical protein